MPEDNQELLLFTGSSLTRPLPLVVNPGKASHEPPRESREKHPWISGENGVKGGIGAYGLLEIESLTC